MRLIDADTLKDVVHKHSYFVSDALNSFDRGMFTVGIDQAIDEMPTVDAVPVVRCRDCMHREQDNRGEWWCTGQRGYGGTVLYCKTADDFFCKNGERIAINVRSKEKEEKTDG